MNPCSSSWAPLRSSWRETLPANAATLKVRTRTTFRIQGWRLRSFVQRDVKTHLFEFTVRTGAGLFPDFAAGSSPAPGPCIAYPQNHPGVQQRTAKMGEICVDMERFPRAHAAMMSHMLGHIDYLEEMIADLSRDAIEARPHLQRAPSAFFSIFMLWRAPRSC